ncbi:SPOR domain-containing protein [Kineococcus gynurae]|uniref:SPOR domain-containing protein n=1 Tax=Kineococcus gynurae TaxID=452979 RepID=A0ABV5LUS4_9ACTN
MSEGRWFYNVSTGAVEEVERRGQAKELMGPYATREEAAHALEKARERTEAWDEEDRRAEE